MSFITKINFQDNRQHRLPNRKSHRLSGTTEFGLPFSALTSGPDLTTSAVTNNIINVVSTFSGNTNETNFTFGAFGMNIANNSFDPITNSNSATTQDSGDVYIGNTSQIVDDNLSYLDYTGVSFEISVTSINEISPGIYTGSVTSNDVYYLSAGTLDFTGRTIWSDVKGIHRTEDIIITNNAQTGYVLTSDSEGKGTWQSPTTGSSGNIYTTGATLNNTTLVFDNNITLSAYTSDLSPLTSYWSAGTSTNAISAKNHNSISSGLNSISWGFSNTASGSGASAYGNSTLASGDYSHAEGSGTVASGGGAHTQGQNNEASGDWSHAEGGLTEASGHYSHAEGLGTTASGIYSHAEGSSTLASGATSHAEGTSTEAFGNSSHAEGINTLASGIRSHAEGTNTEASGNDSHAEGSGTLAFGEVSHAEGYLTEASGDYSHAEGRETVASGDYSHAEGRGTTASGARSHAEGLNTQALSLNDHAEGVGTVASGSSSHAQGQNTIASGSISHAEGINTLASGTRSHAEGSLTEASGIASHAEGDSTTASGSYSHSQNRLTVASGIASHAGGRGDGTTNRVVANGDTSFAHFRNTTTGDLGVYGDNSAILGGVNHNITSGANQSVILGGSGITANTANTVYVPDLVIDGLTSTDPIATDANGKIVAGTSDIRLKKDIQPLSNSIDKIKGLRGVSFEYTPESNMGNGLRYGFIAQEVKEVIPQMVRSRAKSGDMLSLNYTEVIPWLVEGIKDIVNGNITIKNTIFETQTIAAEDNNIELNYNGTHDTAIGGGISVKSGVNENTNSFIKINNDGKWVVGPSITSAQLTLPEYTPTSTYDGIGDTGDVVWDDNHLYIKTNGGWKRTNLESF